MLPLRILRSRLAFHNEGAQARVPQGSGPAAPEAQRRLQSWGSQIDLSAELETGTALSLPSPDRFSAWTRWSRRGQGFVCMHFPDCSAPGSPGKSLPGPGSTNSHCPVVAGQSRFPDITSLLDGPENMNMRS